MAEEKKEVDVVGDAPVQTKTEINGDIKTLTVEELYDKDKFDLSTMECDDVLKLLQCVIKHSNFFSARKIFVIWLGDF